MFALSPALQVIPAVKKAEIREQLTVLSKRVLEAAKAAAAANKEVAVAEAVAAADEAVAAGKGDTMGCLEDWGKCSGKCRKMKQHAFSMGWHTM